MNRISRTEKAFSLFNILILVSFGFSTLFPFVHLMAKALSRDVFIYADKVIFWPIGFQFNAFKYVLQNQNFSRSFMISVLITVTGTVFSMIITVMTAYALSRPRLPGKKVFILLYVFTMLFSGGLIPDYLLMKNLNLLDSLLVLILPVAINPYNMIILINFLLTVDIGIEESAKIDGASYSRILFQIFIPLSKPALATVGLFFAVDEWNDYFSAMVYITDRTLYPLQLYLRTIVINEAKELVNINRLVDTAPESIRAATVIASSLPFFIIYPFIQKYFVKGMTLGAVKG